MVQVGILGFAHAHVGMYCERWREMGDAVEVVAGWDHDAGRLAAAAEKFGLEGCAAVDELLGRADVDAVVIGAETSMHAGVVEQAAGAGKTIVLQKPMALTMAEADRIVAAVEQSGVPFTLAWQMRIDAQNMKLYELVHDGTLGRIYMVRRRHGLSTHLWPDFDQSWHVDPKLNRGMWADDAAHPVDFLLWLLGKPQTVTAEVDTLRSPKVPDDHGIAIYRYADGTFAEVVCSFVCAAGQNTTEIVGEKGVVIQNYGDGPSCNVPRPDGAAGLKWYLHAAGEWTESDIATPANHGERIKDLAGPLAAFMAGACGPIGTAEEGRTVLAMTLASYRAAETGRRVQIDEIT